MANIEKLPYPEKYKFTLEEQKLYDKNTKVIDDTANELIEREEYEVSIFKNKLFEKTVYKRKAQIEWDMGNDEERPKTRTDIIEYKITYLRNLFIEETDKDKKSILFKAIKTLAEKIREAVELDSLDEERLGMASAERETKRYNQDVIIRDEKLVKEAKRKEQQRLKDEQQRLKDIEDAKLLFTPEEVKQQIKDGKVIVHIRQRPSTTIQLLKDNNSYYKLTDIKDLKYFLPDKIYQVWYGVRLTKDLIDAETLELIGKLRDNPNVFKNVPILELNELGKQRLEEYKRLNPKEALKDAENERLKQEKKIREKEAEKKYKEETDERVRKYKEDMRKKKEKKEQEQQQYLIDRENPELYTKTLLKKEQKPSPVNGYRTIPAMYRYTKIETSQDLFIKEKQRRKDELVKLKEDIQLAKDFLPLNNTKKERDNIKEQTIKYNILIREYKETYQGKSGKGIDNPDLYEKAKEIVYNQYPKHSAYRSGQLVKKYKEMGGTYSGKKPKDGLTSWFKEEWKDIGNKSYPVYRPTKRVNKDTPLTPQEIKPSNLKKQIALKQIIKGNSNLPPFEGAGLKVDEFSNYEKAKKNAIKYLGKKIDFKISDKKAKKFMVFNPEKNKWIYFGQMGYEDFLKHQDPIRRNSYLKRTANIKGDWKDDKYSPNNLARNILW